MTTRRSFLTGLAASGFLPQVSWADVGTPAFLTAGRDRQGHFVLVGLSGAGAPLFRHQLPGRGHAAAGHPTRPEAVAFARRPGQFAEVIDCRSGTILTRLTPPSGHHFYGHGCFSPDGTRLFTTENDYDNARGVIGIWEVGTSGYRRIGSFSSGGIGPHDLLLRNGAQGPQLVVANGGIETHPDSGRAKLNLATMQSNLSLLSLSGQLLEQVTLPTDLRLNSIRHLTLASDGTIGFAMQWQGDAGQGHPIVGLHRSGGYLQLLAEGDPRLHNLNGYGGSLAFSADGAEIAVTSPRGGVVQVMNTQSGEIVREHQLADVCGLSSGRSHLIASTGQGHICQLTPKGSTLLHQDEIAWDNHLIALPQL
ncbi:hypothetical protein RSK20926_02884 [Roseobacter sp. SK209-2-6]|uniref:DUF1513 domain-containing protein n=1 Tax=Roseobacter sp. SK209-2-6 TaxID=388739 RepID=UPI0000F3EC06|nr:DUF1513 domain-containing protein [Roseobacter sp. SK209-2-6]EBA16715.1 hypothetical protein RSK20926_02884 [Roseobacter sp. SK209-2-6]